jgi:hypothetical protein
VRIDGTNRSSAPALRAGVRRAASGPAFAAEPAQEAGAAVPAAAVAASAGVEALLALQAVDDPVLARKKAVRRGHGLLDALEALKLDLLLGQIGEGRLQQLAGLVAGLRERALPGLDAVLDEIELRAQVELAKLGR